MRETDPVPEDPSDPQPAPKHPKASRSRRRRPQCKADAKSTGQQCTQDAVHGRDVCKWHGGLTPSTHGLKHGMTSKLPSRLAEGYSRGLADAHLLDQRRSIALMESLAEDLAQRIQEGDTPELREAAAGLATHASGLLGAGDAKAAGEVLTRLARLLRDGLVTDASHNKLFAMADRIGARRDAAWTTKLQRIQVMNSQDVATMLGLVLLRARAKWGEERARELAEIFEAMLSDSPVVRGRGERILAAIPIEGQTVGGGTNGNAAAGS